MNTTVLVGYDFSDAANEALRWAASYVSKTGAGLRVVYVVAPPAPSEFPSPMATYPTDADLAGMRERVRRAAEEVGIDADVEVDVSSNPAATLVAVAEDVDADLIVIGTRARSVLRRVMHASAADYAVHHAGCPVVTVKAARRGDVRETATG